MLYAHGAAVYAGDSGTSSDVEVKPLDTDDESDDESQEPAGDQGCRAVVPAAYALGRATTRDVSSVASEF